MIRALLFVKGNKRKCYRWTSGLCVPACHTTACSVTHQPAVSPPSVTNHMLQSRPKSCMGQQKNSKPYPWLHAFSSRYMQINVTFSKMRKRNLSGDRSLSLSQRETNVSVKSKLQHPPPPTRAVECLENFCSNSPLTGPKSCSNAPPRKNYLSTVFTFQ